MAVTVIATINHINTTLGMWETLQQGSQCLLPEPDTNMAILGQAVWLASNFQGCAAPGPGALFIGSMVGFT